MLTALLADAFLLTQPLLSRMGHGDQVYNEQRQCLSKNENKLHAGALTMPWPEAYHLFLIGLSESALALSM